jgi:hypothetical protein
MYALQARWADAERETGAAVALQPEDARLLSGLGVIRLAQGLEREAEQIFVRARDRNPALPQPRMWLCAIFAAQLRDLDFSTEVQAAARYLPPPAMQFVVAQGQFLRAKGMEMRMRNAPMPWREIMAMLGGAQDPAQIGQQGPNFNAGGLFPHPPIPRPPGPPPAAPYPPGGPPFFPFPPGQFPPVTPADAAKAWWRKITGQ